MVLEKITDMQPVIDYVATTLNQHLAHGERVLWLIPGGSAIEIAVNAALQIRVQEEGQLIVTLTDERYGDIGHSDSNWVQLERAGFTLANAHMVPVLTGQSLQDTTRTYAQTLRKAFNEADFRFGLFGLGADGHTAGILPGSPAVDSTDFACGYIAEKFQRITMTFPAIEQLDEAVVYAMGADKRPALESLLHSVSLDQQPAQIHRNVLQSTVFNDQVKGEI